MASTVINFDTDYSTTFGRIVSVMTSVFGWTLHDDIDSTDKVFSSQGENGNYAPVYVRFDQSSTGNSYFRFYAYQYWNNSTHTGTCVAKNGQYFNMNGVDSFYMMGDKDKFRIVAWKEGDTDISNSEYIFGFFVNKRFDETITTLTSSASSGSLVSVSVADTSGFKEGQSYQIIGSNYEGRDWIEINTVTNSTTLVITNLPRNYASGSYIGTYPCPFGINSGDGNIAYYYSPSYRTNVGTTNDTDNNNRWNITQSFYSSNADPDNATDKYLIGPMAVYDGDAGTVGYVSYSDFGITGNITDNNLLGVTTSGSGPEFGTCNSGTSTIIYDDDKTWTVNEHAGRTVCIANGTGVNQSRKIASNTTNSITIDSISNDVWAITPNSSSMYYIVDEVYRTANYMCMRESY